MAAYTNSLQALNGIYGALDNIIKIISVSKEPQDAKEKTKNDIKNLNKGGLGGVQEAEKPAGSTAVLSTASVRDISSALLSLPPAIKAVAGLGNRSINNVVYVLEKLNSAFTVLSENNDAIKGALALKNLAEGLIKLQELKFFSLILSFNALDRAKVGEKMYRVFKDILTAYKSVGEYTREDLEAFNLFANGTNKLSTTARQFAVMMPLMPMFMLSVALFSPGMKMLAKVIKKMPESDQVKAAVAAAEILNTFAIASMAVVASSILLGVAIKRVGKQEVLIGIGVTTTIMTLLGGLAIAVAKTAKGAKDSDQQLKYVNDFINNLAFTTGLIYGLSIFYAYASSVITPGLLAVGLTILSLSGLAVIIGMAARLMHIRRSLRRVTNFIRSIVLMTGAVMALAVMASVAKDRIVAGLGIVTGIILGLTLITMLVGTLSMLANKRGMASVLGIAAFSLALVLGTMLIGAIITIPGAVETLLLGLATVTGVILSYTLIAMLAGVLGAVLEGTAPLLLNVVKFAGFSMGIVLGTMLIGALVIQGWDLLAAGLAGVLGTMVGFTLIMALTQKVATQAKILELSGAWKDILLFAGGALLLTGAVVGIGALIRNVGIGWMLASLAAVGTVLVGLKLIADEAIKIGTGPELPAGIAAMKEIGIFAGEVLAITAGIVLVAKLMETIDQKGLIAASFGLFSAIMWESYGLALAASRIKPTVDKGLVDIKSIALLMIGAEVLAFGVVGLAKALESTDAGHILGAFGLINLILSESYIVSLLASKNESTIKQGTIDIKTPLALMAASELLAFGIVGLANALETTNIKYITEAFGLVTVILGEAYVLSLLASKNKSTINQGVIDIKSPIALMAASELLAFGIIKLSKSLETTQFKYIAETFALITAIVTGAAGLAAIASKFETQISKGAVALLLVEGVALGGTVALGALIKVAKLGEGEWDNTITAMKQMALLISTVGLVAAAAGLLISGPQAGLFIAGAAGLLACEGIAVGGAKMLEAIINVSIISKDVEFSDIQNVLKNMGEVIKSMAVMAGIAGVAVIPIIAGSIALRKVNKVIDDTCKTITQFIKLSKFINDSGTTPDAMKEDIRTVLGAISPDLLLEFFKEDNMTKKLREIRRASKSYKQIIGVVKSALDMYGKFIQTTRGTKIDNDALIATSSAIAESLSVFMSALDGKTLDVKKKTVKRLSQSLGSLIEPVSNFAELLSKYTGDGNTLRTISYDENGLVREGKPINVVATAQTLLSAVMKFCEVLYNENNEKIWNTITKGTSKKDQNSLQVGIGIFASIIEPIANFAKVLTTFVDGGENTLVIPEYDENGNLKSNLRSVNVVEISRVLANAVTTFIEELYVNHMDSWTSILNSLNMIDPTLAEGEEKAGNKSGLREAIGIFGEILNPVLNFASVLLKFGADQNSLTVFDEEGKPHKVDVAAVSSGIASAVTQFIQKIAGIFSNEDNLLAISKMNDNSANVINVLNAFISSVSNAAQIDQKQLLSATTTVPGFISALSTSIKSLSNNLTEENVNLFNSSFEKLSDILVLFITQTYSPESLAIFDQSTQNLQAIVHNILTGIFVPEEVNAFKITTTDLIEFINSSFTDLMKTITTDDERYNEFLRTNDEMARVIKDSLSTLFSTLSLGEELTVFVTTANATKITIDDTLSHFLKDFVKQDELDSFTNGIELFKTTIYSSLDNALGDVAVIEITTKIATFSSVLRTAFSDMLKTVFIPEDIAAFNSTMDSISLSVRNVLGENITDDSVARFQRILNSVKSSVDILINDKMVTDSDKFNKNLDTLINNLYSASEASKVKKITLLSNAIKTTTGEMSKFDKSLSDGNNARIKRLNEFGEAVGKIANKLNNAKDGMNNLKSVLSAIERVDVNKLNQVSNAVDSGYGGESEGGERRGFLGLGGGRKESKTQVAPIDYNQLAIAFAKALSVVLDNAEIRPDKTVIEQNLERGEKSIPGYRFDVADADSIHNITL